MLPRMFTALVVSAYIALLQTYAAGVASASTVDMTWSQLPAFHDASSTTAPLRGCAGAVIAQRFVLTTATCVTRHQIASVSFSQSSDSSNSSTASRLTASVAETILHPRYEPNGPSRFDVALLELAASLPLAIKPLALDFAPLISGDRLTRVTSSVDGDKQTTSVSVVALAECLRDSASSGLVTLLTDTADGSLVCAAPPSSPALPTSASSQSTDTSILVYESPTMLLLSGIELPQAACIDSRAGSAALPCRSDVYVSLRSVANFINAFVTGQKWRLHTELPAPDPTTPTPTSPTPTPTVPATPAPSAPAPTTPPSTPTPTRPDGGGGGVNTPEQRVFRVMFPYVASLRAKKSGKSFCGGTLVGSFHVVTAAHCVEDGLAKWVTLGTEINGVVQDIAVARVTLHPQYQSTKLLYDVAVIELANFASTARPVLLDNTRDYTNKPSALMLSGGSSATASTLQQDIIAIWPKATCEAQYAIVETPVLCAGGGADGVDACAGDSGSPLIVEYTSGGITTDVFAGIVSAGYGCGQPGVPGFYTRMASVASFVAQHVILTTSAPVSNPAPGIGLLKNPELSTNAPELPPLPSAVPPSMPRPGDTVTVSPRTNSGGITASPVPVNSLPSSPAPQSTTAYPQSIWSERIPSQVTDIVKTKALAFLAGAYDNNAIVSRTLYNKLVAPTNAVVLYSTGDLRGVLNVIEQHAASALNQRSDRFATVMLDDAKRSNVEQCGLVH